MTYPIPPFKPIHITQRRLYSQDSTVFPVLNGAIDTSDPLHFAKKQQVTALTTKFDQLLEVSMGSGGEKAVERHTKRNKKLLAIDRVKLLLDDMDDFIEIGSIAGMGMEYGDIPRASSLAGAIYYTNAGMQDKIQDTRQLGPKATLTKTTRTT